MTIKLGDKIRSVGGVEGEVISISGDRRSATVLVPGVWLSGGEVSIPLIRLQAIDAYTAEAQEPPAPMSLRWRQSLAALSLKVKTPLECP